MKSFDTIKAKPGDLVLEKWEKLLELLQSQAILPGDGILLTTTSNGTSISVAPNFVAFRSKWSTRLSNGVVWVRAGTINGTLPQQAEEYGQEIPLTPDGDTFWVVANVRVKEGKLISFSLGIKTTLSSDNEDEIIYPLSRIRDNRVFHISYFDLQMFFSDSGGKPQYYFCPA